MIQSLIAAATRSAAPIHLRAHANHTRHVRCSPMQATIGFPLKKIHAKTIRGHRGTNFLIVDSGLKTIALGNSSMTFADILTRMTPIGKSNVRTPSLPRRRVPSQAPPFFCSTQPQL